MVVKERVAHGIMMTFRVCDSNCSATSVYHRWTKNQSVHPLKKQATYLLIVPLMEAFQSAANGLPDHDIENYSVAGILPPQLGSTATNTRYNTTEPIYNADSDVFESEVERWQCSEWCRYFNQFGGGTVAVTDETVDDCGGHPGTYHHLSYLMVDNRKGGIGNHSGLTGMSLDGFPILDLRLRWRFGYQ